MISVLLNKTKELIKNCEKIPQEEKQTKIMEQEKDLLANPKEKKPDFSINDFRKALKKIEEELAKGIKDIRNTIAEEEKRKKTEELLSYLSQYLDWIEGCQKISEQIELTNCSKIKECFQLVQFLTIFNQRKNNIHYTNNVEGQIATLKRILREMNKFYQALFSTSEDLISEDILPREKNVYETLEEYEKEIQEFMEKTTKEKIESFINQINNAEKNREESINEVVSETQRNEQSDLKQEDSVFFEAGNIESTVEDKLSFMPEKEITEETINQVTSNKNIPDFLKPYVLKSKEEQIRRDNEFIQKRIQAITNYQEKLYKQMNFYEQRRKSKNISMGASEIYQLTLPYQEACAQEIKRLHALTVEMIYNPEIDLNIPDENIPVYEVLEKIIQKKALNTTNNPSKASSLLHSEKKLEYVPITKKSYEKKGKASPNLKRIIKQRIRELAFASVLALLAGPSLPAKAQTLEKGLFIEKNVEPEINFDDYINLGDFVNLKNFNVFAYNSPILAEDTRKKPLYNSELPRIVEKVFMESPNQEIIEIHEERERNYYLEQGYKIISVKLIDGYYSINDINLLEKERKR